LEVPVVKYDTIMGKIKEREKAKREYKDSGDILSEKNGLVPHLWASQLRLD
jgi:hypothetical protein